MIVRIIGVTLKSIALILLFALGLALTFTGLFFIGIPLIILCIWLYVRLIKKERQRTRDIQATKGITPVKIAKKPNDDYQQGQDDKASATTENHGNPVADAAASYLIGKAVTDKMNQSAKKRTAYRERYAEAQKSAMENRTASKPSATKEKVKLKNGRGGYLHTMPNGNQQLVDFGGRTIARYDKMKNTTYEGQIHAIGRGNLISQFLS